MSIGAGRPPPSWATRAVTARPDPSPSNDGPWIEASGVGAASIAESCPPGQTGAGIAVSVSAAGGVAGGVLDLPGRLTQVALGLLALTLADQPVVVSGAPCALLDLAGRLLDLALKLVAHHAYRPS